MFPFNFEHFFFLPSRHEAQHPPHHDNAMILIIRNPNFIERKSGSTKIFHADELWRRSDVVDDVDDNNSGLGISLRKSLFLVNQILIKETFLKNLLEFFSTVTIASEFLDGA